MGEGGVSSPTTPAVPKALEQQIERYLYERIHQCKEKERRQELATPAPPPGPG